MLTIPHPLVLHDLRKVIVHFQANPLVGQIALDAVDVLCALLLEVGEFTVEVAMIFHFGAGYVDHLPDFFLASLMRISIVSSLPKSSLSVLDCLARRFTSMLAESTIRLFTPIDIR